MKVALIYYCRACEKFGYELLNLGKVSDTEFIATKIYHILKNKDFGCMHCHNRKNFLERKNVTFPENVKAVFADLNQPLDYDYMKYHDSYTYKAILSNKCTI